ncbi:hypothetical protein Zmor_024522 [Zophobas morio]|uniref:Endonuclease/exonuclease/phosphatase domain-containing protein n=1 Tax=Zophobas morio TaxID=2755281 RepID=A0AA38I108_9CUCU|nr:hypothetical protein Zmor_024522 [Zophobas morio]
MEIREKTDAKEVEEFFKKEIEVEVKVLETIIIRKEESKKILVKTLWDEKQEVMKNKNKLRGKRIYIENDWTVQEQKIQKGIREVAKEERKKGYTTRVGYKKLEVGDKMYTWNENKGKLEDKFLKSSHRTNKDFRFKNVDFVHNRGMGKKNGEDKRGLKLLFWNIAGLKKKDNLFWDYVKNFDFVGLTETWN